MMVLLKVVIPFIGGGVNLFSNVLDAGTGYGDSKEFQIGFWNGPLPQFFEKCKPKNSNKLMIPVQSDIRSI
jgi:hypothetical protein